MLGLFNKFCEKYHYTGSDRDYTGKNRGHTRENRANPSSNRGHNGRHRDISLKLRATSCKTVLHRDYIGMIRGSNRGYTVATPAMPPYI